MPVHMHVSMLKLIRISMYVYTHVHTHAHARVHTHACAHTCAHAYTHRCTHTCVHTFLYTCSSSHLSIHYTCRYVHMRVHMSVHIRTHMSIHISIHLFTSLCASPYTLFIQALEHGLTRIRAHAYTHARIDFSRHGPYSAMQEAWALPRLCLCPYTRSHTRLYTGAVMRNRKARPCGIDHEDG